MDIFKKYSRYYNLLYKDKNYRNEANYVDSLIKRYSRSNKKTLLDIGCGTGRHDKHFAEKGYSVVGIDKSAEMIKIARATIAPKNSGMEFHVLDSTHFNLNRKFDIAVALFHVMSYQVSNESFLKTLKNTYRHLNNRGLFIFDFWYGPAVLTQKPSRKIKRASDGNINVKRIATPKINFDENTVDVDYRNIVLYENNGLTKAIKEKHTMRYFFLPELFLMVEIAGFNVIKCLKWMSSKEGLSEKSWSGVIIAKK